MTRGVFITQLEKRLADLFPSWEAKEQELTFEDIQNVTETIIIVRGIAVMELWAKREPEVKA